MNGKGTAYSPPKLEPRIQRAADAGEYDFLLPYSKALYRTDEVADCIGRDPAYVRALIDAGRLEAHRDSALGDRKSSRVTRRSILVYLVETANYETIDIVVRVESVLKTMRPHHITRIIAAAKKRLMEIE
jgi:hypothetical protein